MRVITIKRSVRRANRADEPRGRRAFREFVHKFLTSETAREFIVEALIFAILLATVTWPIIVAAGAIGELLQRSTS